MRQWTYLKLSKSVWKDKNVEIPFKEWDNVRMHFNTDGEEKKERNQGCWWGSSVTLNCYICTLYWGKLTAHFQAAIQGLVCIYKSNLLSHNWNAHTDCFENSCFSYPVLLRGGINKTGLDSKVELSSYPPQPGLPQWARSEGICASVAAVIDGANGSPCLHANTF